MSEFHEKIYTFFYQALKAGNTSLTVSAMERLRNATTELGDLFEAKTKEAAGNVANDVQKALVAAFKAIEEDVERLEDEVKMLREEVAVLYSGDSNTAFDGDE